MYMYFTSYVNFIDIVVDMLKESCKSSEQNSQKVALELQELKKKLRDQRKATERAESDAKRYYDGLSACKSYLHSALDAARVVTDRSSSSSSSRDDRSRDDRSRDTKSRDEKSRDDRQREERSREVEESKEEVKKEDAKKEAVPAIAPRRAQGRCQGRVARTGAT